MTPSAAVIRKGMCIPTEDASASIPGTYHPRPVNEDEIETMNPISVVRTCIHILMICAFGLIASFPAFSQQKTAGPQVEITEPAEQVVQAQESIRIAFKIKNASQRRIRVRLESLGSSHLDSVVSKEIPLTTKGEHLIRVNLFEGKNRISFIVFEDDEPKALPANSLEVTCSGRWCKKAFSIKPDAVASELGATDESVAAGIAEVETPETETVKGTGSEETKKPKTPKQEKTAKEGEKTEDQKGGIHINSPKAERVYADAKTVPLKVTVDRKSKTDATKNLKTVFITVLNEIKASTQTKDIVYPDDVEKPGELTVPINIGPGSNEIIVFDSAKKDDERASVKIVCEEQCGAAAEAKKAVITIEKPKKATTVDAPSIGAFVTVANGSGINRIKYDVRNGDNVIQGDEYVVPAPSGDKPTDIPVRVRIAKGTNTITFFDAAKQNDLDRQEASTVVICSGENCAADFDIAKFASNSQNSRAIVGMEQAGGSSATSETKPFVDFYFTTPFFFSRCSAEPIKAPGEDQATFEERVRAKRKCEAEKLPRVAAWGDVRLTNTPDQIAAASVFPSNFVNQLGKAGTTVDLIQSFDFMAGLEFRLKSATGQFLSLIPGINQRSHFYLAGGGGAINPLNAKRELAQIFRIPGDTSPQRADFITRFGIPPTTTPAKEYVGLIPLDRDRFLRQWYIGARLKTLYCDNENCTRFKNNFPAIVDFMFGQNEAVTGGSLKYTTTDPSDSTKTIEKNSYVLRFDAFYPFPIREANFLYFYGTAIMKIGAGGVRVQNPLFLDTAPGEVLITDSRVYIPPSNLQKMFQPNRDYYKIGVGINLTELFNRNKSPQ